MSKKRLLKGIMLSLMLGLMLSFVVFAEESDFKLISVEMVDDENGLVMSSPHGTVLPDPTVYGACFYNGQAISLNFNMRSFGITTETYEIKIYKGSIVDPNALVTRTVGNFEAERGSYNYAFEWNTTNTALWTPGNYLFVCTSYYNDGKTADAVHNTEDCTVTLEDNRLLLYRQFVDRLYETILNRAADQEGREDWSNKLYTGVATGAEVVRHFLDSQEFFNRGVGEEEYVEILYHALFDRESDEGGKAKWLDCLTQGFSRTYVLRGFIDSAEFGKLCGNYGIVKGDITLTEDRDKNEGVTRFVGRLYNVALSRKPDAGGMNDWTGKLLNKKNTPKEVASGFVFSTEVARKELNNRDFVTLLYRAVMGREPDKEGLNDWAGKLDAKTSTREQVFNGFAESEEFKKIVASYGL